MTGHLHLVMPIAKYGVLHFNFKHTIRLIEWLKNWSSKEKSIENLEKKELIEDIVGICSTKKTKLKRKMKKIQRQIRVFNLKIDFFQSYDLPSNTSYFSHQFQCKIKVKNKSRQS